MKRNPKRPRPLIIVSGSAGASAAGIVNTLLAQFPGHDVPIVTEAHLKDRDRLDKVIARAAKNGGMVVHTLVDDGLRQYLKDAAQARGVPAVDLMGDIIQWLTEVLGCRPLGSPGLYRRLNRQYFDRVEAIEFAMEHDDGRNPQDLSRAQIVLVGLSRVGKTPLSMFLAMQGWRTANVPLVSGSMPPGLEKVDPGRIIGLVIDAQRLASHRRVRGDKLGLRGGGYADLGGVFEETEQSRELFRKKGYAVIDVTDKPLETSADEVTRIITRRYGAETGGDS
ncbi:MAG TPA: pyruvate, water dikinase regulatory protein [Deltaproteobacteria bacterium]|nr:pyruvate, water dikinase regulatory protein [Deltaproteobacteria bacterium]HQI80814.1 pyruvate, water dikinase regulatory protein [Deltaproteobacteria bacterium]